MAQSTLDLILRTKKEGDAEQQTVQGMKSMKISFTELNQAFEVGKKVIEGVGQAYQMLVGDTLKYADSVRDLSRVSGQSSEETSRMIQMSDDFAVSLESLEAAAKGAAMKGIAFTTENMAKLSDQYLALASPVERDTFLLDTFGRSGLEMAKIMEAGSQAIRNGSKAISDNLVLTQKQVDDARLLEIKLDDLNDSFMGLKTTIGNEVIPKVTDFVELINELINLDPKTWFQQGADASAKFINSFFSGKEVYTGFVSSVDQSLQTFDQMESALNADKNAVDGLDGSLEVSTEALNTVESLFKSWTSDLIFQAAAAGLSSNAAYQLAVQMGLVNSETVNLTNRFDALVAKYDTNHNGIIDNTEATKEYYQAVLDLQGSLNDYNDKTVTVTTIFENQGAPLPTSLTANPIAPGPEPAAPAKLAPVANPHRNDHAEGEHSSAFHHWHWNGAAWIEVAQAERAMGGPLDHPWTLINENPLTRPETVVQGAGGSGYVLTKQDAQDSLKNSGGGHNFYFNVPDTVTAEALARRVASIISGGH